MISAKDAAIRTRERIREKLDRELTAIEDMIQQTIDSGHFSFTQCGYIHKETKEKLEKYGYKINAENGYYMIDWGD